MFLDKFISVHIVQVTSNSSDHGCEELSKNMTKNIEKTNTMVSASPVQIFIYESIIVCSNTQSTVSLGYTRINMRDSETTTKCCIFQDMVSCFVYRHIL